MFQVVGHFIHTDNTRHRHKNIKSFLGNAGAFIWAQGIQSGHIVIAVSQFNNDHTRVLQGRLQNFTEGRGFIVFFITGMAEFSHAIDQFGHGPAKFFGNIFFAKFGIFNHIMQQCRHQGFGIQTHMRQNAADRNRMQNIRLAAFTGHAIMRQIGIVTGRKHALAIAFT